MQHGVLHKVRPATEMQHGVLHKVRPAEEMQHGVLGRVVVCRGRASRWACHTHVAAEVELCKAGQQHGFMLDIEHLDLMFGISWVSFMGLA